MKAPTRYTVSIAKGGGTTLEGVVWVFPSNWVGYETEARRLALLLPMQGRIAEVFAPVDDAQDYLKGAIGTLDLSPVIAYGADAFRIFGPVPDLKLKAYSENQAEGYALTVCGIACSLAGTTASAIAGEFKSILSAMFKAHEWGSALPQVLGLTTAPTYAKGLLTAIADNTDNCGVHLEQATWLFNALETEMTALVKQAETDNDPAACRATLDRIRTLSVGPNPNGPSVADHTIHYADFGVTRCDGLSNELCLGALMAQELELIAKYEGDGHSYFDDAYYQKLGFGLDPVEATRTAMSYYEPVIRDLLHVASAFINASLVP